MSVQDAVAIAVKRGDVEAVISTITALCNANDDLKRELAAAQAKLAESIESERLALRNNETLRAKLARYEQRDIEQSMSVIISADRHEQLIECEKRCARYEQARREMPEEPVRYSVGRSIPNNQPLMMPQGSECLDINTWVPSLVYNKLRDHAIAQQVRADEKELDAKRYRLCMLRGFPVRNQSPVNHNLRWTIEGIWFGDTESSCIDEAIKSVGDAAIAAGKEGKT